MDNTADLLANIVLAITRHSAGFAAQLQCCPEAEALAQTITGYLRPPEEEPLRSLQVADDQPH